MKPLLITLISFLIILIIILLTSCTATINLTPTQRAEKKFNHFRPRQNESRLAQVMGFAGVGLGLYYNNNIKPIKP